MSHESIPFIGVVTALEAETKAVCRKAKAEAGEPFPRFDCSTAEARVVCLQCGPGPERALAAARQLISQGADMLLCVGAASGMDREAQSGHLLLTRDVLLLHDAHPMPIPHADQGDADRTPDIQPDNALVKTLEAKKLTVHVRPLLTAPPPLFGQEDRTHWNAETGAAALDTESAGAALAALESHRPFLALRALGDSVERPVSPEVLAACSGGGGWSLFRRIVRHPGLFIKLWRMGREYSNALDALSKAWNPVLEHCVHALLKAAPTGSTPEQPAQSSDSAPDARQESDSSKTPLQ
ncbi:Nucleoside phosphorylase [Paucidesulfovibrio gracilis DSM 16080]|uniref:Nucleoside phosphorylase n=1 Tax=Paucidesulfovibrio gracilis DSM 16080 TaxID=1121449 RepID=A0A1T4W535_9BACT|nr:hypothetical protein [Paucidesulfovibrio gracilis]SKA72259.1 Nucleoside phosphorylase [Paucidesulfovibrio gracilis DSM 16080]